MSALRTALAGLVLGALCASVLQGCDIGKACGGQGECPTPRTAPFLSGTYRASRDAIGQVTEPVLTLSVDEARSHVTERYERDGHTYETEYEVVGITSVGTVMHGGVPLTP